MTEVSYQPSSYETPINELGIFDQVRRGNIGAYSAVYIRYAQDIFRFIFAQVPDPQISEDLTEETFIKAWLTLQDQNIPSDQYKITLFQIASELIGNHHKTRNHPSNRKVPRLLSQLPVPLRNLLILSYILELPEQEISQILRIKQGLLKPLNQWALAILSLHLKLKRLDYHPVRWLLNNQNAFMPPEKFEQRSTGRLIELIKIMRLRQVNQAFQRSLKPAKVKPAFQFSKFAFQVITLMVITAVMFFTSANVVFAAQGSLPGDTLFSTKLVLEDFQLAVQHEAEQKANLHIQFAESRIEEISTLAGHGRYADIDLALDNLNGHLSEIQHYIQFNDQGFSKHTGIMLMTLESGLQEHLTLISSIQSQVSTQSQGKLALQTLVSQSSLASITAFVSSGTSVETRSGDGVSIQGDKSPTNFSSSDNDPLGGLKRNNQSGKANGKGNGANPHGNPPGQDKDKNNNGGDKGGGGGQGKE